MTHAAAHVPGQKSSDKKPLYKDLLFQVIVAILAGVGVGYAYPEFGAQLKPLGDGFIKLIAMMIAPIIFCTIVAGVAGVGSMTQVGRVGIKALIYFEIITTLALVIGLVVVNVLEPGMDLKIDPSTIDVTAAQAKIKGVELQSTTDFFLHIIPKTLLSAFAEGEILQVLLISILFSWALLLMGERGRGIAKGIDGISHVFFGMIAIITRLAPIGAFGAMGYTIGKYGVGSLISLGELLLIFYGTCIAFIVVILGTVMRLYCGISLWQFIRYIKEELVIVLGTSSSETVLPRMIDKMTALGCARPVVGVVIPTGYSFNLDGTSIYLTMAALFICFATGTEITLTHQLTLLGVLLLTSKGAAGVTGSGFVVLAATLASLKIVPPDALSIGLALIFAVDRFMSGGRALTNLIGNGIATIVVAKWENALDITRARAVLSGKRDAHLETDANIEVK